MHSSPVLNKVYLSTQKTYRIINDTLPDLMSFKPDVLLSVGKGGWLPGCYVHGLLRHNGLLFEHYSTGIKSYTVQDTVALDITHYQPLGEKLERALAGKRMLIVDDIGDSLRTTHYLVDYLKTHIEKPTICLFMVLEKVRDRPFSLDVQTIVGKRVLDKWIVFEWEIPFFTDRTVINYEQDAKEFDAITV